MAIGDRTNLRFNSLTKHRTNSTDRTLQQSPSKDGTGHRFEIIKKLGSGTYGKVSLAVDHKNEKEVAVKIIRKSAIENQQDLLRIRREIRIMSALSHPNIIEIYEVFENRDKIIIVMEYANGGELYDHVSTHGSLREKEARRIFRQITSAIYFCHKHSVTHRDLKLENILLDTNMNAKIADFGLSNYFCENSLLRTFCGSPLYASPEIINGTPYRGPEVDCWSLGVLLYTLVYGSMPFDGRDFNRMIRQIKKGAYYEPDTASSASMLIRTMLRVNPDRRASIDDIASHWWLNLDDSELAIASLPENQIPVDLTPLIERKETMVVQNIGDENDIFCEFSHLSSGTRKKIEEFRRRRREAEKYMGKYGATASLTQTETAAAADDTAQMSTAQLPSPTAVVDMNDPLERLKALEVRLGITKEEPKSVDHSVGQAVRESTNEPLRLSVSPRVTPSREVTPMREERPMETRPTRTTHDFNTFEAETAAAIDQSEAELANQLINELLEEASKGPISHTLVRKVVESSAYESQPMLKEIYNSVIAAQVAQKLPKRTATSDRIEEMSQSRTFRSTKRTASKSARTASPASLLSALDGQTELDSRSVTPVAKPPSGATLPPQPQPQLPDIIPPAVKIPPSPEVEEEDLLEPIRRKPDLVAAGSVEFESSLNSRPQPHQFSIEQEIEASESEEEEEETTESSEGNLHTDKDVTVRSISDFEDLAEEESDESEEIKTAMEPMADEQLDSASDSYSSAFSHVVTGGAGHQPMTAEEEAEFLRGLTKRQSRGKYERSKLLYGREISIEESAPIQIRKRIGGAQPDPSEAQVLFDRAAQYILTFPEPPAVPEIPLPAGSNSKTDKNADRRNMWLKTADPDILAQSQEKSDSNQVEEEKNEDKFDHKFYRTLWPPPRHVSNEEPMAKSPPAEVQNIVITDKPSDEEFHSDPFVLQSPPVGKTRLQSPIESEEKIPPDPTNFYSTSSHNSHTTPEKPTEHHYNSARNSSISPKDSNSTAYWNSAANNYSSAGNNSNSTVIHVGSEDKFERPTSLNVPSKTPPEYFTFTADSAVGHSYARGAEKSPTETAGSPELTSAAARRLHYRQKRERSKTTGLTGLTGLSTSSGPITLDYANLYSKASKLLTETDESDEVTKPIESASVSVATDNSANSVPPPTTTNSYLDSKYRSYGLTDYISSNPARKSAVDDKFAGIKSYAKPRYNPDSYRNYNENLLSSPTAPVESLSHFRQRFHLDHLPPIESRREATPDDNTKQRQNQTKSVLELIDDVLLNARKNHPTTDTRRHTVGIYSDSNSDAITSKYEPKASAYDHHHHNPHHRTSAYEPTTTQKSYHSAYTNPYSGGSTQRYQSAALNNFRSKFDDNVHYRKSHYDVEKETDAKHTNSTEDKKRNFRYGGAFDLLKKRSRSLERDLAAANILSPPIAEISKTTTFSPNQSSSQLFVTYHNGTNSDGADKRSKSSLKSILKSKGGSEEEKQPDSLDSTGRSYGQQPTEAKSTGSRFMEKVKRHLSNEKLNFCRGDKTSSTAADNSIESVPTASKHYSSAGYGTTGTYRSAVESGRGGYGSNTVGVTTDKESSTGEKSRKKRNFLNLGRKSTSSDSFDRSGKNSDSSGGEDPDATGSKSHSAGRKSPHSPLDKLRGFFSRSRSNDESKTAPTTVSSPTPTQPQITSTQQPQQSNYQPVSYRKSYNTAYRPHAYMPMTRYWYEDPSLY